MEGGKNRATLNLKDKFQADYTVNCSVSARNLRKNDLGGVIFGCKHNTMQECYSKLLFGLPAGHFSYVKNIEPGLPLFLFNYNGRKLNGIFEAASRGQLNIDPFGWADRSERSPYEAQVRIKIIANCPALSEEQFKPIISENYYLPRLFWFELDKNQAGKLISLFSSFPSHPLNCLKPANHEEKISQKLAVSAKLLGNEVSYGKPDQYIPEKHINDVKTSDPPVKVWSSLFKKIQKQDPCSDVLVSENRDQNMDHDKLISQATISLSRMEIRPSCSKTCEESDIILKNAPVVEEVLISKVSDDPVPSDILKPTKLPVDSAIVNSDCGDVDAMDSKVDPTHTDRVHTSSSLGNSEIFPHVKNQYTEEIYLEDKDEDMTDSKSASDADVNDSSDLQTVITKLVKINEQLTASQSVQSQKIIFLEEELKRSRMEVQQLKYHYVSMGTGSISTSKEADVIDSDLGQGSDLHDSIFIIGGFDGNSWLSSLELYSPSRNKMTPLTPMKFSRSYTSAAKLIDKIYVLGGGDRESLFDTVEAYDQRTDNWICQPPLNKKKGSLAVASLHNKIYAIGGGNGTECFSEVEVLDPNVGRWTYTQRMIQNRFAPAVETINGALHVVGGYDGTNYLKSAERLDVREPSWAKVASMITCRGCHRLTVLGGKLYAVGGYDGSGIVDTVEVFEPKKGVWRGEEPMKEARAYAGAVTMGETMVVMGGMTAYEKISDTVEVYEEGKGWRSMGHKSIGKRSFFTAIVA